MRESNAVRWVRRLGLSVLTLVVTLPLVVMVTTSLSSLGEIQQGFRWVPRHATLRAYTRVWTAVPLGHYVVNSIVVSVTTTVLAIAVALPAGYALARSTGRGPRAFGVLLIATQAAPGLLFLLPLFLVYAKVGDATGVELIGTYPGLIVTDLTFALPVSIWLLGNAIGATPLDVEEAARIDGAGHRTVLLRVVVPSVAPALVACSLLAFVTAWGEVLFATVLTDAATTTVPVGLHDFATQSTVYWNELMAAALTTSVPVLGAFWVARSVLGEGASGRR